MGKVGTPWMKLDGKTYDKSNQHHGNNKAVMCEALEERWCSDEDIDREKTKFNIYAGTRSGLQLMTDIDKEIADYNAHAKERGKRCIRNDAITSFALIVKPDGDFINNLSKKEQMDFFKDAFDIMLHKFGKNEETGKVNLRAMAIHVDEGNTHMHLFGVPWTPDGRLSAKEIFNKDFCDWLNKGFPAELRSRGWDIEDCVDKDAYNRETAKQMHAEIDNAKTDEERQQKQQEYDEYLAKCKAHKKEKKKQVGKTSKAYKSEKRAEKALEQAQQMQQQQQILQQQLLDAEVEMNAEKYAIESYAQVTTAELDEREQNAEAKERQLFSRSEKIDEREQNAEAKERQLFSRSEKIDEYLDDISKLHADAQKLHDDAKSVAMNENAEWRMRKFMEQYTFGGKSLYAMFKEEEPALEQKRITFERNLAELERKYNRIQKTHERSNQYDFSL